MNGALQIARFGLTRSLESFERTAERLVRDVRLESLPESLIDLQRDRNAFTASARVLATSDELLGTLLDVVG